MTRAIIETLKIFGLVLVVRASILPYHSTRFLALHPCEAQVGLPIVLPVVGIALVVLLLTALLLGEKRIKYASLLLMIAAVAAIAIETTTGEQYRKFIEWRHVAFFRNAILVALFGAAAAILNFYAHIREHRDHRNEWLVLGLIFFAPWLWMITDDLFTTPNLLILITATIFLIGLVTSLRIIFSRISKNTPRFSSYDFSFIVISLLVSGTLLYFCRLN